MNTHQSFPSIEQFRNLVKNIQRKTQFAGLDSTGGPIYDSSKQLPTLKLKGTVKIDGSNAAICFQGGGYYCQSRNRIITPEDDNYGFATFVKSLPETEIAFLRSLVGGHGILFFEWAGKGIQDTVAVSKVDKFATLIAVRYGDHVWADISKWQDAAETRMPNQCRIYNVYQFGSYEKVINFADPVDVATKLNEMTEITDKIDKLCPVGEFFGVQACGEGVVWTVDHPDYDFSKFNYKNKGISHSKSEVKITPTVNVEKIKTVQNYVERHTHEGRLQQGWNWLAENGKFLDKTSTPDFLRWVVTDVEKEEGDEREASGLTEKDVNAAISRAARDWFFKKIDNQPL